MIEDRKFTYSAFFAVRLASRSPRTPTICLSNQMIAKMNSFESRQPTLAATAGHRIRRLVPRQYQLSPNRPARSVSKFSFEKGLGIVRSAPIIIASFK